MEPKTNLRSIHISLPAALVSELDTNMVGDRVNGAYWSRAQLVAVAIRRFLDQGGVQLMWDSEEK